MIVEVIPYLFEQAAKGIAGGISDIFRSNPLWVVLGVLVLLGLFKLLELAFWAVRKAWLFILLAAALGAAGALLRRF